MFPRSLIIVVVATATIAIGAAGAWWKLRPQEAAVPNTSEEAADSSDEGAEPGEASTKILVGDQAQQNLGLTSKAIATEVFWKSITVPGMIVVRPGFTDREIVAPATGVVTHLYHVPGETVRPGEKLFTLRLASESIHQTQSELFKAIQNLKLADAKRQRLVGGGDAIAGVRIIEAESEIARLEATAKAYRQELRLRAFTQADIDGIENGNLLTEVTIVTPPVIAGEAALDAPDNASAASPGDPQTFAYEVQSLNAELGQQVEAGQELCSLSSNKLLAIEGKAFRDETMLLERSIAEGWPVTVDFHEEANSDWPATTQEYPIKYIANTVDPLTRTFAFWMPLENQFREVHRDRGVQLLWRYRPGQKVAIRVRVEKLENVFVLPADAVVFEGAEAYIFTQNVNTFERVSVHVVYRDRDRVVVAEDGSLPTYARDGGRKTISAVARTAAAQLNRMAKAGSSETPKGFHIHADGSLHKNEDEGK